MGILERKLLNAFMDVSCADSRLVKMQSVRDLMGQAQGAGMERTPRLALERVSPPRGALPRIIFMLSVGSAAGGMLQAMEVPGT